MQNDLKNLGCFRLVDIYVDTIDKDKGDNDTGEEDDKDINQKSYQVSYSFLFEFPPPLSFRISNERKKNISTCRRALGYSQYESYL